MEHVDEYLRAAAWMGASPLPSVRSRPANLHAGLVLILGTVVAVIGLIALVLNLD